MVALRRRNKHVPEGFAGNRAGFEPGHLLAGVVEIDNLALAIEHQDQCTALIEDRFLESVMGLLWHAGLGAIVATGGDSGVVASLQAAPALPV